MKEDIKNSNNIKEPNNNIEKQINNESDKENFLQETKKECVGECIGKRENEEKTIKEYKKNEDEKNRAKTILVVSGIIFIILLFSIIFALFNINNNKIIKNVSILGIDVSNLSIKEAKRRINEAIEEKFNNENENILLKHGDIEVSINASSINAKFDIDNAVVEAYNIGRKGNIITNNYNILWTLLFKREIQPRLIFDANVLENTITDINSKMQDSVKEYSYYIEDSNLCVVTGEAGYIIKKEELSTKILKQIKNIHNPYKEIEIPIKYVKPAPINLEKIYSEIYKEPQDAYIEKGDNQKVKVYPEINGVDFGISIEEAQKLLLEDKKEYVIPLKIILPKQTLADLGEKAFPEQLAQYSTTYDIGNSNRAHNIELASDKINGTIIMPGEIFSYNTTTGKRTIEAGYREGTAYIRGKLLPDIGGGVCQVSSTLYNVALLANLEITERSNHIFSTGYVPLSRDATVYYGSIDLCFKNTRNYPIKIESSSKDGVCKISLYGIKEDVEYEVILKSKVISYISYKTVYKQDPTLKEGEERVEQKGHNGCRSEGYRILKLNGKTVSTTLLSKDNYSPLERIVRQGTKKLVKQQQN